MRPSWLNQPDSTALLPRLSWVAYCTVIALGLAHAWAFAPRTDWWLGLLSLVGWCIVLQRHTFSSRQVFTLGWLYGAAWFGKGVWWLYISLHTYGEMPWLMAAVAIVLFAGVLALFPALVALFYHQWRTRLQGNASANITALSSILFFASLFAFSEWARGTLFTGFPWLASGYAQIDGPFAVFAPYVGVYGVAWLLAACAISLALLLHTVRLPSLVLISVIILLAWLAPQFNFTQNHQHPLHVNLIQGNVAQETKFDPARLAETVQLYEGLLTQINDKPADLVVTPETALPILVQQIPQATFTHLSDFARLHNTILLLGAVGADSPTAYTNSVFTIAPQASALRSQRGYDYRYDKHHLVPFGEFVPWGFRWFVNYMKIPLGDFKRGALVQKPFSVKGIYFAPNICYEDVFGEEIAYALRENVAPTEKNEYMGYDTNVLVNMTNIGWFGDTEVVPQHLQISRMRSLEVGRPMLRATNNGATAIIDYTGHVVAQLPAFTRAVLSGDVQGRSGLTPFARWGNAPFLAVSLLCLGFGILLARRAARF